MLLVSFVSNNLSNNERRHFKPYTNCHDSWDTVYMVFNAFSFDQKYLRGCPTGIPQGVPQVYVSQGVPQVSHRCPTGVPQGVPQVYVPQGVPQVSHRCSTGCPTSYFKEYSEILKRMNHLNKMCKANKKNLKKKLGFSSNICSYFGFKGWR